MKYSSPKRLSENVIFLVAGSSRSGTPAKIPDRDGLVTVKISILGLLDRMRRAGLVTRRMTVKIIFKIIQSIPILLSVLVS